MAIGRLLVFVVTLLGSAALVAATPAAASVQDGCDDTRCANKNCGYGAGKVCEYINEGTDCKDKNCGVS